VGRARAQAQAQAQAQVQAQAQAQRRNCNPSLRIAFNMEMRWNITGGGTRNYLIEGETIEISLEEGGQEVYLS